MNSSWHNVVGPWFKPRQGKEISPTLKPSRLTLESTQPLIHCLPAFFPGVKQPGREVTSRHRLVPRLILSVAIHLPPLYGPTVPPC